MTEHLDDKPLLVDASVAIKWLMPVDREADAELARELLGAHDLKTTTLAHYEVASTVLRIHPGRGAAAIEACALLRAICGEPLGLDASSVTAASELAEKHGLTFYDASYAAIAQGHGLALVSADNDLIEPGLAQTLDGLLR